MALRDDLQDAMLSAQADIMEVIAEITDEMQAADLVREMGKVWATLPADLKEAFKRDRPQDYAALVKGQGATNGNYK